jgi:hypothetical protein
MLRFAIANSWKETHCVIDVSTSYVSRSSGSSKTCGWGAISSRWRWICHDADAVKDVAVLLLWCFVVWDVV